MSYLSDLGTFLKGEREGVTLELDNKLNALAPYSGYFAVSKKLDNFYFQTSSSFIASMADKNRYVKFLDKVVDTWSAVIQTTSTQTANATATTLTMSNTTGLTVGKVIAILKGDLLVHTSVITAVSTNVSITLLNSFNREATAYKIKIIQSINLNDYIPDVLVQDEAINGLIIQSSVNAGDMVVVDRIVQTGVELYRAKINAPIGTLLTNTTYFETRDSIGVTNQILVAHKYNTLTNSYEGLSAEILFSNVSKEDLLDNSVWLSRNGFSKAGEFCYSKGTYLYLPVSIWQTLNKGAYHEFLNKFGASFFKSETTDYNASWYETTKIPSLNTMSDCFADGQPVLTRIFGRYLNNGVISGSILDGLSGKAIPDSKYYDIVYPDQVIDVREYAKTLTKWEVDLIRADKEENGVEEVIVGFTQAFTPIQKGLDSSQVFIELGVSNNFTTYGDNVNWSTTTTPNYNIALIDASGVVHKNCFAGFSANGRYLHWIEGFTNTSIVNIIGTCYIVAIKTNSVLSSNTKLSTDLIGNPTNYPQIMKDRLAEGKGIIGVNPLLVSDTGVSLLPNGSKYQFKLYKKSTQRLSVLETADSGATYTLLSDGGNSGQAYISYIVNELIVGTTPVTNDVLFASYTSKNLPYIQTTPKSVIEVLPKVKASNSHSIYKGALVGNQVSGKVQVGNGSNEYESKVLEKTEVTYDYVARNDTYVPLAPNNTYLIGTDGVGNGTYKVGQVVKYTGSTTLSSWLPNPTSFTDGGQLLGYTDLVPTHSTIALDNANSPASKWFEVIEEGKNGVLAGVYGKELAYNSGTTSFDGDNELFDQLYNGSKTDLNGATVRTFHGSLPINGRIK